MQKSTAAPRENASARPYPGIRTVSLERRENAHHMMEDRVVLLIDPDDPESAASVEAFLNKMVETCGPDGLAFDPGAVWVGEDHNRVANCIIAPVGHQLHGAIDGYGPHFYRKLQMLLSGKDADQITFHD